MNERDIEGNTKLHIAVMRKNIAEVSKLVEKGANIFAKNDYGKYPFHYTLNSGFYEALPYVATKEMLNTIDDKGRLPSYYCCTNGSMIYQMITIGLDLDLKDAYGKTTIWHIYNNMNIFDTSIIDAHYLILEKTDPEELIDIPPAIKRYAYIRSRITLKV